MPTYLARVRRTVVEGEQVQIQLDVIEDPSTVVHLNEGDEFVTIVTKIDLAQPAA